MSNKKDSFKFYLNSKIDSLHFVEDFKGRICTKRIIHILKTPCMSFFNTKGNCIFNSIVTDP